MERVLWRQEYRLGVEHIDADHLAICAILERFLKAVDDGEDADVVGFTELRDRLEEHFGNEEAFLSKVGYPEAAAMAHIELHLDMLFTRDHEFGKWQRGSGGASKASGWRRRTAAPADPACQPRPGTPLFVEYSKCRAWPGKTSGWMAWAAAAASAKPLRMSLSLPG